jgi:hypothetical protein
MLGSRRSNANLIHPIPDLEFVSFYNPSSTSQIKVFTDSGGFSTASLVFVDENPGYARFQGKISTKLASNRPDIECSGFAGRWTVNPKWTLCCQQKLNV